MENANRKSSLQLKFQFYTEAICFSEKRRENNEAVLLKFGNQFLKEYVVLEYCQQF